MKIAFLCEGDSEFESIPELLKKAGIYNIQFFKEWDENVDMQPGMHYIYRHNYKGIGTIRKQYIGFAKKLIDDMRFSKVLVWFDNESILPICEYARKQYELIGPSYADRIDLTISVEGLENWFLSNKDILRQLLDLGSDIDTAYLSSKGIIDFLALGNVDNLNGGVMLYNLKKNTRVENYTKPKLACRFFSFFNPCLNYRSDSFSRFLNKIRAIA